MIFCFTFFPITLAVISNFDSLLSDMFVKIISFFCNAKLILSRLELHDHFAVLFFHDLDELRSINEGSIAAAAATADFFKMHAELS